MYGWECLWLCVIFLCTRYSFERIFVHGSVRQLIEEREKWGRKKKENTLSFFSFWYIKKNHTYFSNFLAMLFFVWPFVTIFNFIWSTWFTIVNSNLTLLKKKPCEICEKLVWSFTLIYSMYIDLNGEKNVSLWSFFGYWKSRKLKSIFQNEIKSVCCHVHTYIIFSIFLYNKALKSHYTFMSFLLQLTV